MNTLKKSMQQRPELTAFVQEQLKQFDRHNLIDAENHGIRNKPALAEWNIKSYLIGNHYKAQEIIAHVGCDLQPEILASEVHENETITQRKLQDLQNELVCNREHSIEFDQHNQNTQPELYKVRLFLLWFIICVPLLGDGILNRSTFETYGYSWIESLCMSILLAASLAVLAHSFKRIVTLGKTKSLRRIISVTILALVTALFYYLADARAAYLSHQANIDLPTADIHFSAIPFTILSVLLFVVALAINHFFFPSKEQRKLISEYLAAKRAHDDNAAERRRIEYEIERLKHTHEELRHINSSLYIYGCHLEEAIILRAQAAFVAWQKTNMMYRTDNGRPMCFGDEYPFEFQRNFKPVNQL